MDVIGTALRARAVRRGKHPVLVASTRFSTGPMSVPATQPTAMQKAAHQVELPYLLPTAQRVAQARELANAYNNGLTRAAPPIAGSDIFSFPYRLLDDQAVSQFEAMYPGGNVYSEELEKKRRAVSSRDRLFFDGSTTLWRVSRVAFVSNGSLAVVGLRSSGGSCTSETWAVLERSLGSWRGLHWGANLLTCA